MYKNVSIHKQKAIRNIICTEHYHNKIWDIRIEEDILIFAEIYRLIYDVSEEIFLQCFFSYAFIKKYELNVPQEVLNILVHAYTDINSLHSIMRI